MDTEENLDTELLQQLQKSLQMVKASLEVHNQVTKVCKPCIDSVLNLTEQYQCCDRVKPSLLPNKVDFADVKERLLFKIGEEINKELDIIKSELKSFEECSVKLGTHFAQSMGSYRKHCSINVPDVVLERSATRASVADALECLETSSRLYRERCMCKQLLVQRFSPRQPDVGDTFLKQWSAGDACMIRQLEEHLALCSGFLQAEVT